MYSKSSKVKEIDKTIRTCVCENGNMYTTGRKTDKIVYNTKIGPRRVVVIS